MVSSPAPRRRCSPQPPSLSHSLLFSLFLQIYPLNIILESHYLCLYLLTNNHHLGRGGSGCGRARLPLPTSLFLSRSRSPLPPVSFSPFLPLPLSLPLSHTPLPLPLSLPPPLPLALHGLRVTTSEARPAHTSPRTMQVECYLQALEFAPLTLAHVLRPPQYLPALLQLRL